MEPIIEFKNFCFQYDSQTEPTLLDINLKIYPKERVLIVGPSGSGKSTLAHCINALNPCSRPGKTMGTLKVDGVDPAKAGVFGMSRIVGTVLQDTDGQFIGLTVAEDIAFALENDAVLQESMKRRVDEVSELIEMKPFLKHSPTALSGGQKQRVSMGGVLVDDVKILLFDEPLANLDPATGKNAISLIEEIGQKRDVTVLIIEHRLEDALYRDVDRIIVVGEGRIVYDGTPADLLCSNILNEQGIREPLYLTAIKHAGCEVSPEDHPESITKMNLSPYRDALRNWYEHTETVPKRIHKNEVLSVSDLCFSYKPEEPVLKNISFTIYEGEMLSLVGKNGAGKTTLSSLILGFIAPTSGEIKLLERDITPLSVKERGEKIGLVMQSPNQMISKPMIRDEVALGLKVRGIPEEEINKRVKKVLKICGLWPFRNWPVGALSFGQKKRVSIASILVLEPKILILDEPTAGQDYRHYTEIMEFLKELNQTMGLTIVMITHDMHLMLEYTDRAIVLSDGELIADDHPAKILTDKEICERAYLKETSLYELSVKCGIEEADSFVERFISFERENRKWADD